MEIIFATVLLKIYILAISYHRLQHEGQEIEYCHCAEHYFIIENVVVDRGFIDFKV